MVWVTLLHTAAGGLPGSINGGGGSCWQHLAYSDAKVANRDVRDFGWEIAHAAVSRRPPISLYATVARTHMNTYRSPRAKP
jgi:hypothetical protein